MRCSKLQRNSITSSATAISTSSTQDARSNESHRRTPCRLLTGQQRRNTAHGDTAVLLVGSLHWHLELLLTVALRRQVLGRNLELFGQSSRNRLRAAVRE